MFLLLTLKQIKSMENDMPLKELLFRSLEKTAFRVCIAIFLFLLGIPHTYAKDSSTLKTTSFRSFPDTETTMVLNNNEEANDFTFNSPLQNIKVTGAVKDKDGTPLPGVNVFVTGTTHGTTTDANGKYSLDIPQGSKSITFSFIGMETQEITIGASTQVNVTLMELATSLQEVVVIGYGSMKKSDLTGSLGSISVKEIANLPEPNLFNAVQGKIPGLIINNSDFAPGADPEILIRGINSLSSSNTPLIILDGMPFIGGLTQINPSDIQSIDVLKDASSAAIYGSRGSNGVIIITTKSGKNGKPVITYQGTVGFASQTKNISVLNRDGYIKLRQDIAKINGQTNLDPAGLLFSGELEAYNNKTSTDWQDLISRKAMQQNHQLSISGANDNINYYVSIEHLDQDGIIKGSNYVRNSLRFNGSYNVTKWLKFGTNSQISSEDFGHHSTADVSNAMSMSPLGKPYNNDGSLNVYPLHPDDFFANPLDGLNDQKQDIRTRAIVNMFGLIEVPFVKGLSYRLNYGNTYENRGTNNFWPSTSFVGIPNSGSADVITNKMTDWTLEHILKYNQAFGKHRIDFTALYSRQKNTVDVVDIHGQSFINDNLSFYGIGNGKVLTTLSNNTEWSMESIMGRLNYIFNDKYYATLTVRTDGYSGFGSNNKYGTFPSVALGWTISEESFLKDLTPISFLKLRASYGLNGNQAIPPYRTLSGISGGADYYLSNSTAIGFYPSSLGNSSLGWESTQTLNIGLDFSLYKDRITGSIDAYFRKATSLLLQRKIPTATGFNTIWDNVASTQNRGIEFNIKPKIITGPDFNWTANFSFALNRNKIIKLLGDNQDDKVNKWFVGNPVDVNYNYVITGVWQTTDDIAHSYMPSSKPGDLKLKDVNNDGQINDADRVIQGSSLPDYTFGINSDFTYKNFTLSFFIYSVQGGKRNNELLNLSEWLAYRRNCIDVPYWSLDNPSTKYSSPIYQNPYSLDFLEDLSFIKLKDLTLSYNIPAVFLEKYKISSLRIFATGNNLITITHWSGYDPENRSGFLDGYPSQRTVSFGVNVSF
jgi:TonB-dependent starch-binding outer membrane protein SusC